MAKKKINWWRAVAASLLFVSVVYAVAWHHKQVTRYYYKACRLFTRHHHPSHPGRVEYVTFPEGYEIHGVDISHYQDDVNWDNLKALSTEGDTINFTFAFIKATEGTWKEDRTFAESWGDAHDRHVCCGAYHYFLPDEDARKQAENFISSVTLRAGDLPPVIDIEETRGRSKQEIVDGVKTMAALLEVRYGARPIIYSHISFIEDYLSDDFSDYYFWVAHFYEDELKISDEINWLFWQHNNRAMLMGDDQHIDVNVFNGNIFEFRNILIQDGPRIRAN